MLSILLMEKQGIDVIPINFNIGVFFKKYIRENGKLTYKKPVPFKRPVTVIDISDDFLKMLQKPAHGYGANMNPCIDCKIMMMQKAKALMEEYDAGFVITGEVQGQRPMTQNSRSMNVIKNESGLEGFLLRPLSAKLLPETEPEKLGWVDRSQLLDIEGRGRNRQLKLAQEFGIKDIIESPGGGCLLTDENYSRRLKDMIEHKAGAEIKERDMFLLSTGRHLRINGKKFIIGRDKEENERLLQTINDEAVTFELAQMPGPLGICFDPLTEMDISVLASVLIHYSKAKTESSAKVKVIKRGQEEIIETGPATEVFCESARVDR